MKVWPQVPPYGVGTLGERARWPLGVTTQDHGAPPGSGLPELGTETAPSISLDLARDRAIAERNARLVDRVDAAIALGLRLALGLLLALGGAWALLSYLEPCSPAGSLCMATVLTPTRRGLRSRLRARLRALLPALVAAAAGAPTSAKAWAHRWRCALRAAYIRHRIAAAEFDLAIYDQDEILLPQRRALTRAALASLRVQLVDCEAGE